MRAPTPETEIFEIFARSARDSSPLYEHLARRVAMDDEVLAITAHVRPRHLQPNLLLGAVHYLLLKGAASDLRRAYPSLGGAAPFAADVFRHFRLFVLAHAQEIQTLTATRRVQTNEVRRCTALVPGISAAAVALGADRAAFIEIGASAGLNLHWDRYRCDYGDDIAWGEESSRVAMVCELRGEGRPHFLRLPKILQRYGIDIAPLDVKNADDILWLKALIWPEHDDRRALLDRAIEIAKADPPRLIAGDAADFLPSVAESIARDLPIVVYHSFTMNQLGTGQREALEDAFCRIGARRPLARVGLEWAVGAKCPTLSLTNYSGVQIERSLLAECDAHGTWLRWVDAGSVRP